MPAKPPVHQRLGYNYNPNQNQFNQFNSQMQRPHQQFPQPLPPMHQAPPIHQAPPMHQPPPMHQVPPMQQVPLMQQPSMHHMLPMQQVSPMQNLTQSQPPVQYGPPPQNYQNALPDSYHSNYINTSHYGQELPAFNYPPQYNPPPLIHEQPSTYQGFNQPYQNFNEPPNQFHQSHNFNEYNPNYQIPSLNQDYVPTVQGIQPLNNTNNFNEVRPNTSIENRLPERIVKYQSNRDSLALKNAHQGKRQYNSNSNNIDILKKKRTNSTLCAVPTVDSTTNSSVKVHLSSIKIKFL